jgi:hypothetical protein
MPDQSRLALGASSAYKRAGVFDICRILRQPPPRKPSCCIRVPSEIVKRPDPATYDAETLFAGGALPTYNSPDINTVRVWPMAPIETLTATVRNLSLDANAQRTRVDLSWSAFGIGLARIPIASSFGLFAKCG